MRLLLIRHGETAHNAGQIALGREDVPLDERGLLQATALVKPLARETVRAIYSSPLQRAVATATPLAEAVGLPVTIEYDLIEMDVGEVEGLSFPKLGERYPSFLRAWRSEQVADVTMPGGENLRQVAERAWRAVMTIRDRHEEETVVVVSHNFVILTLLCHVMGMSLSDFRRVRQDLGAVSLLEVERDRSVVMRLNDRCHLEGDGLAD